MSWLTTLIDTFVYVALRDPISFILVAMGALLVGGASAAFGVLSLGAVAELLTPDLSQGRAG
jgi:hypothetical protein